MQTISLPTARRIALAAQGFADRRPAGPVNRQQLRRVLNRIQLLQLDSVNVAVRAHYAPLFSRLGAYPRQVVDDAAWTHSARRPRMLVEYWAHEASLVPVQDWPLLRSGAKRPGWWRGYGALAERSPTLVDEVRAAVAELGPVGAGALERELGGDRGGGPGAWWERSDIKKICEWLFGIGELTTGERQGFERRYDLTERVIPPDIRHRAVSPEQGARELISKAAAALGVATEPDLRDYYRLSPELSQRAVAELVEDGALEPVQVAGWRQPAYRDPRVRAPRRVPARALLCPFDPLIWERARTERLFDFRYRIEIYVPEAKRVYGYYVFPFLLDERLVARVDLKADRERGVLWVRSAFAEPAVEHQRVAAELAAELAEMARWLELDGLVVDDRGDLARALRAAVG